MGNNRFLTAIKDGPAVQMTPIRALPPALPCEETLREIEMLGRAIVEQAENRRRVMLRAEACRIHAARNPLLAADLIAEALDMDMLARAAGAAAAGLECVRADVMRAAGLECWL